MSRGRGRGRGVNPNSLQAKLQLTDVDDKKMALELTRNKAAVGAQAPLKPYPDYEMPVRRRLSDDVQARFDQLAELAFIMNGKYKNSGYFLMSSGAVDHGTCSSSGRSELYVE
jgi:hypothetical protein